MPQPAPSELPLHDVNLLLHELRGREIARIPGEGRVVLSGGCPDRQYFDWFAARYCGTIDEHIAIELFRDEPDDLPDAVRFVRGSLCDLGPLPDQSVDLIFAGQVVEHLPPEDLVGFLVAARRVLRPDGRLVLDSPNRAVTLPLRWHHPEHVLELTPEEAGELLGLAGFAVESMTGIWLCRDPAFQTLLPLAATESPARWPVSARVDDAREHPESSFIWWAVATPGGSPLPRALEARVSELFMRHRSQYFAQLVQPLVGREIEDGGRRYVVADQHQAGFLLIGPYVALPPGPVSATFTVPAYCPDVAAAVDGSTAALRVEIIGGDARDVLAVHELAAQDLPRHGEALEITLRAEPSETVFGCETRAYSTGAAPVAVARTVAVASGARAAAPGLRRVTGTAPLPPPSGLRRMRDRFRRTRAGGAVAHVVGRSPMLQRLAHR